ncbi:hypothetical protein [Flavobacterium sp. 1355]|jgi:hypothetical protein|uniref:hypothetical protein n=1 Tax=Flavobacterium sp. 1355 TaxID=2806571 RepID=UPI001AE44E64|nr:hypothetical protein [Flavobacterium sp. 1355]MBP1223619.1 hypothetical protein [Flavobacterium sp. 1355]
MKTNKKEIKKFDLDKMSVAKLKNLKAIQGGQIDDDKTITDLATGGNDRNTYQLN